MREKQKERELESPHNPLSPLPDKTATANNAWVLFFGEHLEFECLDQGLTSTGSFRFEEDLEDNRIPFLEMLQSVETSSSPSFLPLKEPSFQTLLKLQHLKKHQPWEEGHITGYNISNILEMETQIQALEFDQSCVTHDIVAMHESSPIKSEAKDGQYLHQYPLSTSECINQEEQPSSVENCCKELGTTDSKTIWAQPQPALKQTQNPKSNPVTRERRKRKRTRPTKNKEEVETQRMTHIAVERNRRRQMNDHLNVLRSLMPTSYIQRGDQASIVGGAIDFVKELEQLLQSLEAQKRMRKAEDNNTVCTSTTSSSSSSAAAATVPSFNGLFMSLSQYRIGREEDIKNNSSSNNNNNNHLNNNNVSNLGEEVRAENKSEAADIEVTVIQTHVNLKIQCPRRPGQLLTAIIALEDLRLSVLHLNITSSQDTVLYSFNLRIEDGCKLGTADEIAGAVHQIFRFIKHGS
ncbi:hypothetical protein TIFTF001_046699 [Ficus carica]|uniref:BHLH domain-containing protein n=1 Tax=Ficus carica TaxID=3494 RepID=A0AA87ZGN7_FICCA|nr:hypothetical protein TIFTF001_046698 [Ficus carica]GMN33398.1 hypothetical protein TIFTF001_046699 [Ficus carica]